MASGLNFAVVLLGLGSAAALLGLTETQIQLANQAEQSLRSNNLAAALSLLDKASGLTSTAGGEDRIGFLYAVAGHQAEAAEHFRKSIRDDGNFAAAHYHLGVLEWLAKDQDEALPELETAVRLAPQNFDFRLRLGSAYVETGASVKGVTELKAAIALDKAKPEAWQELGVAQQQTNDLANAVQSFAKAVELNPASDDIRNGYCSLLIATRQPQRAINEAQTVLAHNKYNVTAYLNMGQAYLKMGEFEKAQKAYEEVVALDANSVAAHYDLGISLKMQDQLEAAQKEFEQAIKLDPNLAESHYTLGITKWQLGDFPGTIDQMKAAIAIRPGYAEAHYTMGIALKQSGDLDAALAELKESIRLDPTTPGPYNTIGQILRLKGDKQGSEEAFAQGTKLKSERDKQLSDALEQGMRGGILPTPMAAPLAKVEPH